MSGSIPLNDYLNMLVEVGFGTLEVRAKRPYRILDTAHYPSEENLYIESVEVCAIKDPMLKTAPVFLLVKQPFILEMTTFSTTIKGISPTKPTLVSLR